MQSNLNLLNKVDLIIPIVPNSLTLVRLATSAITGKLDFSIDEIEDIKVAVSEVCNALINQSPNLNDRCSIQFCASHDKLKIIFKLENKKPDKFKLFTNKNSLALPILNSLVDNVKIDFSNKSRKVIILTVFKKES